MRYDDASQASSANAEPIARADTEVLPQGSFGPATGNAITGAGTTSGSSGADSATAPATIAAVQGAGGATGQAAGSFHATGQYGVLSMDAEGNFSYVRNPGTPDGVQDVFQYTLADASGAQSSTTLTIDIAQVAAAQAGQGIVNLPAGVEMSDIHVNGRDLVIDMPDGTQMVIPGGAVFVPQLAIGDVEVPPTNLAALLINSEPQPAAGPPLSSGGNFAVDVPPLDPGVPLGDLIPPTELSYTPPEFEELANAIDHKPTVIIITPDNPAGAVDAVANVDESGLPARGSEPPGTLESENIETTSGTIVFVAEDGLQSITVGGVEVTGVNQVINGAHGTLTITSIDLASGQIGFSYTATDNTTDGVDDFEDFPVVVTDADGDTATGNLHINIADDEPIALNDVDTLNADEQTADGNVMTGANTTTGASGHDTVGADNASLTAVSGADGSDNSFNGDGNLVVHGAYGTLSIDAQGNYTYVRDAGAPDNVSDVFTYTLTDGDGDTATATLTIIVPNLNEPPVVHSSTVNVSEEGLAGGNPDTTGTPDTTNSASATGNIGLSDPDGDATTVTLGVPTGSYTSGGAAVNWAVSADGHTLVGYTGSDSTANHVIEVSITNAGTYTVNLIQPFDDPNVTIEDSVGFTIPVSVNDGTVTVSTSIAVTVEDDAPNAVNDTDSLSGNTAVGNVVTGVGTTNGGADSYGGDGPGSVTGIHPGTSGSFTAVPQDGGDVLVHGTFGDLVIHDDGSYTYTRSPNSVAGGSDVFTYQLTDGDGDTDTATLTITVPNINTIPSIVSADDAVVDEDGLKGANVDANPLQTNPTETNSTEDASFTGQIHVDFKTDVPANLGNAITLVDTAALDGQLHALDGQAINFSLESGVLVGRPAGGGDPLITIAITGVTAGSGGNATYTYEVDLLGAIQHSNPNSEDTISLNGVTFQITDSNGDHSPAPGTFDVSIVDDVPTAVADSGTVTEGDTLTVVAADGVLANDVYGADGKGGGGVVGVEHGSDTSSAVSGNVGVQIDGDYGHLTLNADGSYTYVSTDGAVPPAGATDTFVYTIVDGDGDTDTVTLTINLNNSNQLPVAGEASAAVDDEGLANGIPGDVSNGDIDANAGESGAGASDEHIYTGTLGGSGGDSPTSFLFEQSLDGQTAAVGTETVVYQVSGDGQTLTAIIDGGDRDGSTLFTVHIDNAAGDYTLTLVNPVMHTYGDNTEASATLDIPYQMQDSDTDLSASPGTLHVTFNDDMPVASTVNAEGLGHIVVDESPIGQDEGGDNDPAGVRSANADLSGHFTGGAYGADGAGSTTYDLSLSSEGAHSGLFALGVDGAKGSEILLYTDGDNIVGKVGSDVYFTISVAASGAGAGTVTFTQEDGQNVWHANTGSDDDTSSLAAAAGTIELNQTITDADGDHASASLDLSNGIFQIEDDGPTAATANQEGLGHVVVDESPVGQDEGGDNDPAGVRSAGVDFSSHFTGGSYGTDGAGSTTYDLSLSSEGAHSGLFALGVDGAKGAEILLYTDGDNIVGKVGSELYFTISVTASGTGAGTVTFTQEDGQNVWHADPTNPDDTSSLVAAAGTIELNQTITDADGDHASASLDLSNGIFQIEDDGPTGGTGDNNPLGHIVVDESPVGQDEGGDNDPAGVRSASADLSSHFTGGSYGTDGPGTTTYDLNLSSEGAGSGLFALGVNGAKGSEILLYTDGDTIVGKVGSEVYFTISVTESGTGAGTVTFTQADGHNVWNANTGSDDDTSSLVASAGTITLDQVITDADGDHVNGSIDLSNGLFQIEDDGPTAATVDASGLGHIVVDESPVGQDEGGDNDPAGVRSASASLSGAFTGGGYGTDGAGTTVYGLHLSAEGAHSGLFALGANGAKGSEILLYTNGADIVGKVGSTVYFTISAAASGVNAGTVTFTQTDGENVWHANTGSDDDTSSLVAAAGTIDLNQTITDADGDHASASLDLSNGVFQIEDDGPSATSPSLGAGTVTVDETGPLGASPPTAIALTDGVHSYTAGDDEDVSGAGRISSAVSTGGAMATASINFGTDGPLGGTAATGTNYALTIAAGGASGVTTTEGEAITLVQLDNGSVLGVVQGAGEHAGKVAFAISINGSTGAVQVDQYISLKHPNASDPNDALHLQAGSLNVVVTGTDADGDKASVSQDITTHVTFFDDGPQVTAPTLGAGTVTVDESGPLGGSPPAAIALTDGVHTYVAGDDEDVTGSGRLSSGTSTGTMASATINFGADGPLGGSAANGTSYALAISASGATDLTTTEGEAITLVQLDNGNVLGVVQGVGEHGGKVAFAISINSSSGAVQVDEYLSLKHPVNPDPNDALHLKAGSLSIVVTGTDLDGDKASSTAIDITTHVTFLDDGPTAVSAVPVTTGLDNGGNDSVTLSLDSGDNNVFNNFGADGPGKVIFTNDTITALTTRALTHEGAALSYNISADGQLLTGYVDNGDHTLGAGDTTVFTIQLQPGNSSNYTVTMVNSLDSLKSVDFDDGSYAHNGGNPAFYSFFQAAVDNSPDLLITPVVNGAMSGTINLNSNLFGVSGGNTIGSGEAVRVDFVTDVVSSGGNLGDWTYDGHYDVNGATASLVATPGDAVVKISALQDPDGNNTVGDGSLQHVNGVVIKYNGSTSALITTSGNVTVGGHAYTVTFNANGTVDIGGVTGTSNGSLHTDVAVFADHAYNELQFDYVSGTAFQVGNFGAAVPTQDPVDFSVPISIMDGDLDPVSSGNIAIHVSGSGGSSALMAAQTTQGFKTALASNDNSSSTNAALLGAVAAAGLTASQDVAAHNVVDHASLHDDRLAARASDHAQTLSVSTHHERGDRGGDHLDVRSGGQHDAIVSKTAIHHDEVQSQQHAGNQHQQSAPAELLHGTSAPVHAHGAGPAAVTAAAIAMPSAEQLAAVSANAGQPQHDQVVGKVLADALHGGQGHGPNIEALVNSLPGHGHAPAIEALASHNEGHVPHGHSAFAGVFSAGHNMLTADHMAAHHDAPPPHA